MHVLEKLKTPFNTLTDAVVEKHTINFWLQKFSPLWSVNQALGKIVQKHTAATDMVSLTLEVNRLFQFGQAGQHHPVFLNVNGIRYERTYSLTQIDARHVQLNVKKVDLGKVSSWLVDQAKVGDMIEFGQPFGDMQLPTQSKPLILLAAGSGITPMLSLLQTLAQSGEMAAQPVNLLYWVRKPDDAAFKAVFEAFAAKFSHFKFDIFYTSEQTDARLNQAHLAQFDQIAQSTVYACGPSGFVAQAEALFAHAACFKSEAFSMSPVQQGSEIGFVNITLTQSNKVLSIPKGQSILASLEQQNVKPNHGCRMGICNKCACNKVEGSTQNLVNGAQNTEPGNLLKICVNSAQTDLVIDL